MDGHGHDRLNDDALAREIEATLAVDPSPEFQARLRSRVATERIQHGWNRPFSWATVAIAGVAVAVLGIWLGRATPAPAPGRQPLMAEAPVPMPDAPLAVRMPDAVRPAVVAEAPETAAPVAREARPQPRRQEALPEVLVSPYEADELRQLFIALNARRVEPSVVPALGPPPEPLAPIEEIVLEPITLSPLARLDSEEGVRQ